MSPAEMTEPFKMPFEMWTVNHELCFPCGKGQFLEGATPEMRPFIKFFDHLLLLLCCCRMTLTLVLGWVTIFGRVYRLGM